MITKEKPRVMSEAEEYAFRELFADTPYENFDLTFNGQYDMTHDQRSRDLSYFGGSDQGYTGGIVSPGTVVGSDPTGQYMYDPFAGVNPFGATDAYDMAGGNYQAGQPRLSVEQYIRRSDLLYRRLTDISEKGFIADALLVGGADVTGGTVTYTRSESIYLQGDPEIIPEGGPYPIAGDVPAPPLVAEAQKHGLLTFITEEMVRRNQFPQVEIKMRKLTNNLIRLVDGIFMNAVMTDPGIPSRAASASWDTLSTTIDLDIFRTVSDIQQYGGGEGYNPNTLVLHPNKIPSLMANDRIRAAYQNPGAPQDPIFTGQLPPLFGIDVMFTPHVPSANTALIIDRNVFGQRGDEVPQEVITLPYDYRYDRVWLRGRRIMLTFVQEPGAGKVITGV